MFDKSSSPLIQCAREEKANQQVPPERETTPRLPATHVQQDRPAGSPAPQTEGSAAIDPLIDYSLKRSRRLAGQANYQRLFRRGRSVRGEWLSLRLLPSEKGPGRFGCTVRRGATADAVGRNRVKRWLRESFRRNPQDRPEGFDMVVVVQRVPEGANYRSAEKEYLALCKRVKAE